MAISRWLTISWLCVSCGQASVQGLTLEDIAVPDGYDFEGVAYAEPTLHHVLLQDLSDEIGRLSHRIEAHRSPPFDDGVQPGEVRAWLEGLYAADADHLADEPIRLTTQPATAQVVYGDLAARASSLADAVGRVDARDHRDWSTDMLGRLGGVGPRTLVADLLDRLDENAVAHAGGRRSPVHPEELLPPHVTEEGLDLRVLLTTFVEGAIAYRRVADDALDEGLAADEPARSWDLAFGYFGASRRYPGGPRVVGGPRFEDDSGDGRIDLSREYSFGMSVTCARRDAGSRVATSWSADLWLAFRRGRAIIAQAGLPMSSVEQAWLEGERDSIVRAWDAALAATVVHDINEVLGAVCACSDPNYVYDHSSFLEHAEAWSALEGHALALQFNPRGRMSAEHLEQLYLWIGDAPVHPRPEAPGALASYEANLRRARDLIAEIYGFDPENLGDEGGDGGW